jgi:hypothetical protein
VSGESPGAERELRGAIPELDRCGMALFAAAARAELSELTARADRGALSEAANEYFREQQIVEPELLSRVLVPGA